MKKTVKFLLLSLFILPLIGNAQIRIIGTGIGTATTVNATTTSASNIILGNGSGAGSMNTIIGNNAGLANTATDNSFYGAYSGQSIVTGNYNTFNGALSGAYGGTAAEKNTFSGYSSGASNEANNNAFYGFMSGKDNRSGIFNSFFGSNSGNFNIAGSYNSFFGNSAGFNNYADSNSFFGSVSGYNNTIGRKNSFFGTESGQSNITGNANTFSGYRCGYSNTANNNSFFGAMSGFGNTSGDKNSFFGTGSGQINSIGSLNTFMGYESGYNTWGDANTFLGQDAGKSNTGGSNNTSLGAASDVGFPNGQYLTAVGYGAIVNASSNAMVLGGTDLVSPPTHVNVGIGTTSPAANLHLESNTARELILEHARKDDEVSAFNLRAGLSGSSGSENDLLISLNAPAAAMPIAGYGLYPQALPTLTSNPAPLLPWNNLAMIATKHSPLYIGTYQTQTLDYAQNIHFVTGVNTSTASTLLTPWECLRINKSDGFVGVHTRNTGTGDPQALFHVNLTNPGKPNLNTATEGIRFQGLPALPHPSVVVIDAQGNLAIQPYSSGGSGGSYSCDTITKYCAWGLYGNTIGPLTPTVYIGTNDSIDFRMYTNGNHRARITNDGNWDFGLNNTFTGVGTRTMTGTFGFRNSISNHVKVSFAFGQDNVIDNSDAVLVSGTNNLVSGTSNDVLVAGSINRVINRSSNSTALGEKNLIDESERSITTGESNIISSASDDCGALGKSNLIEKSVSSFAMGQRNEIRVSGPAAIAVGMKNIINNSDQSVALGEENEMNNAHGTIMAGGHNKSFGRYNVVIGHRLIASTAATPMTALGTLEENIMIIGEEINNDLRHSLVTGFTGNRTTVTTQRGLAVQLDPNGLNTYGPTVNFEVNADPFSGAAMPPCPLRSNIRFHNLPNSTDSLPAVVIDPATGELFMSNRTYARTGTTSGETPNEELIETVKRQQKQIDDQQKQINDLMALVKTGLNPTTSVPTINVELTDKDAIVLDQNIPNPFDSQTIIGYNIPTDVKVAHVIIRTVEGKVLKDITITERGRGVINIYQTDIAAGTYVYSLIADDKMIDTKKMEFVK